MQLEIREPSQGITGSEWDDAHQLRQGSYVGMVRFHDSQYEFLVRDTRREGPTIHGSKHGFEDATSAVSRVLNALASKQ